MGQHPKEKPVDVEAVPDEEDVSQADAAERLEQDPDEVPNATEPERIADADHPEDR